MVGIFVPPELFHTFERAHVPQFDLNRSVCSISNRYFPIHVLAQDVVGLVLHLVNPSGRLGIFENPYRVMPTHP